MQGALERLNRLPPEEAAAELLACCGSFRWARAIAARRPFGFASELFVAADEIWRSLNPEDWLDAFAAHPQIGEKPAEKQLEPGTGSELSSRWSAEEQSGVDQHSGDVAATLGAGNRAYHERFGYIFIVCATGKTAPEMLAILEQRLQNDASAELPIAAEEQRQIMQLRLHKLLAEPPAR